MIIDRTYATDAFELRADDNVVQVHVTLTETTRTRLSDEHVRIDERVVANWSYSPEPVS